MDEIATGVNVGNQRCERPVPVDERRASGLRLRALVPFGSSAHGNASSRPRSQRRRPNSANHNKRGSGVSKKITAYPCSLRSRPASSMALPYGLPITR